MYGKDSILKFSNQRKQSKKELPIGVQYINAFAGVASLLLAIYLLFQDVKIDRMQDLLVHQQKQDSLLVLSNQKQDSAIAFLIMQVTELQNIGSIETSTSRKIEKQLLLQQSESNERKLSKKFAHQQDINNLFTANENLKSLNKTYYSYDGDFSPTKAKYLKNSASIDSLLLGQFSNPILTSSILFDVWYKFFKENQRQIIFINSEGFGHDITVSNYDNAEHYIYEKAEKQWVQLESLTKQTDSVLIQQSVLD